MLSTLASLGCRFLRAERTCSSVKAREPQSERIIVSRVLVVDKERGRSGRTCVMDHHDLGEPDKVVESKYAVQRGRGMAAHVPHDYCLWWQVSRSRLRCFKSQCVKHDLPAGRSPRNCSGTQRGSAQVTTEKLVGSRRVEGGWLNERTTTRGAVNPADESSERSGRGEAVVA